MKGFEMMSSISGMGYANYASYGSARSGASEMSNTNLATESTQMSGANAVAGASLNAMKAANDMGAEVLKILGNTFDVRA